MKSDSADHPQGAVPKGPPDLPPMRIASVYAAHLELPPREFLMFKDGDLEVGVVRGPFTVMTSGVSPIVRPGGRALEATPPQPTEFPEGAYVVMIDSWRPSRDRSARSRISLRFDAIAGLLQAAFPNVLAFRLYHGPFLREGEWAFAPEHSVRLRAVSARDPVEFAREAQPRLTALGALAAGTRERLELMGRLAVRALNMDSPVDRLLALWTILEIYVQESHEIVDVVSKRLGTDLSLPWKQVRRDLHLKVAYEYRCRIVHKGLSHVHPAWEKHFDQSLERLEAVALHCIRSLAGAPVTSELDRYLKRRDA